MTPLDGVDATAAARKRVTRRERFLALMSQMLPWARLVLALEPPDGGATLDVERMLRLHFVQRWYALSDEGVEDALHDMASLRRFVGIDLRIERLPDAAATREFRRRLENSREAGALLAEIDAHLSSQGLRVNPGAIVEATISAWSIAPRGVARRRRAVDRGDEGT